MLKCLWLASYEDVNAIPLSVLSVLLQLDFERYAGAGGDCAASAGRIYAVAAKNTERPRPDARRAPPFYPELCPCGQIKAVKVY